MRRDAMRQGHEGAQRSLNARQENSNGAIEHPQTHPSAAFSDANIDAFITGNNRRMLLGLRSNFERSKFMLQKYLEGKDDNSLLDENVISSLNMLEGHVDNLLLDSSSQGSDKQETTPVGCQGGQSKAVLDDDMLHRLQELQAKLPGVLNDITNRSRSRPAADQPEMSVNTLEEITPSMLEAQCSNHDENVKTGTKVKSARSGLKRCLSRPFKRRTIFKRSRSRKAASKHPYIQSPYPYIQPGCEHADKRPSTVMSDSSQGERAIDKPQHCSRKRFSFKNICLGIFGHGLSPRNSFSSSDSSEALLPVPGLSRVKDVSR